MNFDLLLEAERRGILPDDKRQLLAEARRRGLVHEQEYDPTAGMSGYEKLMSGIGGGMTDVARGIGQMVGAVSREDVAEARRLDAPLSRTTEGKIGQVIGTGVPLAATALIPGANTLAGAAAIGAGSGLAMPSESTGETLANVGMGGALAPAAILGGRAVGAGYQGLKSLVAPFFRQGQEKIAANTLRAFAADPAAAVGRVRAAGQSPISGVKRTVAELADDPGLAQLQRSILNNPEGKALTQQMLENSTARMNALADIAGDEGKRALFDSSRRTAAAELYGKALDAGIDPAALTPSLKGEVTKLLKRPSVQQAMNDARALAAEEGIKLTDKSSLRGLHYAKLALDDQIEAATRAGQNQKASALIGTRDKLLGVIEKLNPDYAEARITFQKMSEPINQMDVGKYLLDKAAPPLFGGGQLGMNKAQFGRAMQSPDRTAKSATKFAGAKMEKVMTPEQMSILKAIEKELAGVANAENLGRATGSNTAQNLVSQNTLRQLLGPLGLPQGWAENTMLQTLMRPIQFTSKLGEPKVVEKIAGSMADPEEFLRLISMVENPSALQRLAPEAARYLPAVGLLGLPSNK
jgi:hypothetical protein